MGVNLHRVLSDHPQLLPFLLILVGGGALSVNLIVSNAYSLTFPTAVLVGTLLFLVIKPSDDVSVQNVVYEPKIVQILFCLLVGLTVLIYRQAAYTRTTTVHLLIIIGYVIVVLLAFSPANDRTVLSFVIIAALVDRVTAYYNSSLYTGMDIFSHSVWARSIVEHGSLIGLAEAKYYYTPAYHFLAAFMGMVGNVEIREALFLTILLVVTVAPGLLVFLLIRQWWSSKVGLLGALLYLGSDFAIYWTFYPVTTSLGIVFAALCIFSAYEIVNCKKKRHFLLFGISMVGVAITHQVSTTVTVVSVIVYLAFYSLYRKQYVDHSVVISVISGLILYLSFTVIKSFGPAGYDEAFFDTATRHLSTALLSASMGERTEFAIPNDPAITATGASGYTLIHLAGTGILITLAVFGALHAILSPKEIETRANAWAFGGVVAATLGISLSGPLAGISYLTPTRWFVFTYIPLTVLAAFGFTALIARTSTTSRNNRRAIGVIVVILLIGPYFLFMGGNLFATADDPLFDDAPGAERLSVTAHEYHTYRFVVQHGADQTVRGDSRAGEVLTRYYGYENYETISIEYQNSNSIEGPSLILNRDYLSSPHARYYIEVDSRQIMVYGSFPIDKVNNLDQASIYTTGGDEIILYKD